MWSCACAPAPAAERDVAEHFPPFDRKSHTRVWPRRHQKACSHRPRMAKKLARRKNLYFTGRSRLPEDPSWDDGKQAGFLELRRLPRSLNRGAQVRGIRVPGLNLGRAITPPLDGNSAGAHPIAPGIEQTA